MKTNVLKNSIKSIISITVLVASTTTVAGSFNQRSILTQIGADNNSVENSFIQPQDPALSGGGRDQTMQFADILFGSYYDDLLADYANGAGGADYVVLCGKDSLTRPVPDSLIPLEETSYFSIYKVQKPDTSATP